MTHGCETTFPPSQLKKALSEDMLLKYMERVQNEDLKLANIKVGILLLQVFFTNSKTPEDLPVHQPFFMLEWGFRCHNTWLNFGYVGVNNRK